MPEPKISDKLVLVWELTKGPVVAPATTLKVVGVSLEALIPEVRALEEALASAAPQDAAPSPLDEFRRRKDELRAKMEAGVRDFRTGLADALQQAADELRAGE